MRALWVALALCLCGPALARENYALLIGADDYPNLDAHYWLKSPFNDVALVATYLAPAAPVPFAPDSITVLTNGAGQTPHNLYAIRGAVADLAARAAPGDFVYLLAVLPDSPRPDAIWLLPGTGLASNLVTTPSIGTADKPPQDLALAMEQTLGSMGRALTLLKLGATVGAGTLDVTVEMRTRTPNQPHPARPARSASAHPVARGCGACAGAKQHGCAGCERAVCRRRLCHKPLVSRRLQPGDVLKKGLFKIGCDVLGQERMVVVLTPALPQRPVEDLSFLAQPSLDLIRGAGSALSLALRDAGLGETTRGAVGLEDETAGPAPEPSQLELRPVAGE